ncbi:FMN-binding protein MioC [Vibrio sinensis]|uniref:FMN-binding protein MioC n=1 Tax=Vibrio sinensis TaxID=2302434 RepID=A0A3A6QIX2_9VIBR|nr:FMN-binding protein MioC [Vibrio sinensis]RJX66639.1 FMN-binding protein MioC [Vibrio sinensis]
MIHIITGSTLGGAEYVGDHLSDLLVEKGHTTKIHNHPSLEEIEADGTWLVITSTHGAGDYPDNIKSFIETLQNTPPRMNNVQFAVIGIGDSSYDTFCAAGKHAHQLLEDIGGRAISDCFTIDILQSGVPEDAAEEWLLEHITHF